jgi:large subunit ribosomal protein L23
MALFKKKTEKEVSEKISKKDTANKTKSVDVNRNLENIIKKPRITEKALTNNDKSNSYAFEINKDANKNDVKEAIEKVYNVTPIKVNITNLPRKKVGVRRGKGFKKAIKKAIVYLKKGDKIDFV